MTGDTKLLDQAERRKKFRVIEDDFSENFFVKEIETPRAKPDQVDQKHCESDRDDRDYCAGPFEDAF